MQGWTTPTPGADVYTQPETTAKGQFRSAQHFFGKSARGTVADYERPLPGGAMKRCVRVEMIPLGDTPAGNDGADRRPIKMELSPSDAAALCAVLTGIAGQLHVRLTRPGVRKSLAVMRGSAQGLSWVVRMFESGGKAPARELMAPLEADDALAVVGLVGVVLHARNPGLDASVWQRQVEKIGVLTANASAMKEGQHV